MRPDDLLLHRVVRALLLASMLVSPSRIPAAPVIVDPAGWVDFSPGLDPPSADVALDLRSLNEARAGEKGFVRVEGGRFVRGAAGSPVRFWGVNGPPEGLDRESLRRVASLLARRGVNLVRIHRPLFDDQGNLVGSRIREVQETVEVMSEEGIYTFLSIYFPLWLRPAPGTPWLPGYDGRKHPFAALFFSPGFQDRYRSWWTALLQTPNPVTGRRLVDEPALAAIEIQNEDSLLFPTFEPQAIPAPQIEILEKRFGGWLAERYGSIDAALDGWTAATPGIRPRLAMSSGSLEGAWRRGRRHLAAWWKGVALPGDSPADGRVAIRPLWQMVEARTPRDQDTVRFLVELQSGFYEETRDFLRSAGYRAAITASNWTTASPAVLGPLEKLSYLGGDFLDRHAYFDCARAGEGAAYSIREGHTYRDRSALRLEAEDGTPGTAWSPAADPRFAGRPSTTTEIAWTRPNRHRSEAPVFLAAYGALQGTDAIVHFWLDSQTWSVQPRALVSPWTLMTPAMMGQFPAAAVLFRQGLVAPGEVVARVTLDRKSLFRLEGTPLPLLDNPDPMRGAPTSPDGRLVADRARLLPFMGRMEVEFKDGRGSAWTEVPGREPPVGSGTVTSSTGELRLDVGTGVLVLDAPSAQGAGGNLSRAGSVRTTDLTVRSGLEVGQILAVALDGQPLARSRRILLQVMSEERPTGFRDEPAQAGLRRITSVGRDPWQIRRLSGNVAFDRPDAGRLDVEALDLVGRPVGRIGDARSIDLLPSTVHYLVRPSARDPARPGTR